MKTPVIQTQNQVPLRIKADAVHRLSSLTQFHGIPDETLIRLAKRRTGLRVPDRWVAIALILGNYIPIPVPAPERRKDVQANDVHANGAAIPPKLTVIIGGRIVR